MTRRSTAEIEQDAFADLVAALESIGCETRHSRERASSPDQGCDFEVVLPDGTGIAVEVKAISYASAASIAKIVRAAAAETSVLRVVVADDVPQASRDILRRAGWGWLSRRGHLSLRAPGLFVSESVDVAVRGQRPDDDAMRGRAAIGTAAALLMQPDEPLGVRAVARLIDMAPSTVSAAMAKLRDASLVRSDGRPLVPELFRELARVWKPRVVALSGAPDPANRAAARRLRFGTDSETGDGWALTGTLGALAWGAPLAASHDYSPDFYVPDVGVLRSAEDRYGSARRASSPKATIAVAPTRAATARRWVRAGDGIWRVAHPLFVALDLAQDASRGAEALEEWTPPEPFIRVW